MSTELREVTSVLRNPDPNVIVPGEKVMEWMRSSDMEVAGAVYQLLATAEQRDRVRPPLEPVQYVSFILGYYERCIDGDLRGDWVLTRYEAGWDFGHWFLMLWDEPGVSRTTLGTLKAWLGALYIRSGEDVRLCIVTSILEHLCERDEVAAFFVDWRDHPELAQALRDAMC